MPNSRGRVTNAVPELGPLPKRLSPRSTRPSGFVNFAIAIWPIVRVRPFVNDPEMRPSSPIEKFDSVPIGEPSWKTAASEEPWSARLETP